MQLTIVTTRLLFFSFSKQYRILPSPQTTRSFPRQPPLFHHHPYFPLFFLQHQRTWTPSTVQRKQHMVDLCLSQGSRRLWLCHHVKLGKCNYGTVCSFSLNTFCVFLGADGSGKGTKTGRGPGPWLSYGKYTFEFFKCFFFFALLKAFHFLWHVHFRTQKVVKPFVKNRHSFSYLPVNKRVFSCLRQYLLYCHWWKKRVSIISRYYVCGTAYVQ